MSDLKLKKLILLAGDIVLLYASLWFTLILRNQELPSADLLNQHLMPFTLLFAVWLIIFYMNGLYDLAASKNDVEFYNRILRNLLLGFALAVAYFYLLTDRLFDIKPRAIYLIFAGFFGVFFSFWRYGFNSFVQSPLRLKNILVIGMKDEARELIQEIIKKPQLGYRITAIVHGGGADYDFPGVVMYDGTANLKNLLKLHNISTVVTSLNPHSNPELVQNLFESLSLKLQFYDLPTFYEKLTGKIPVTTIGHIWFLENLAEGDKMVYESLKRATDILFASFGLVLSLPLIPFLVLLIKMGGAGPIFFQQTRIGHLGKPFQAIKFRSMMVDAEENGPQWAQKNDTRVTRVGRFLRKARLDEIPQLINVLRGEMSFIGPRPERPEFVKNLQSLIPFYNERHLVKPGLTGWAQVNFPYGSSTGDALKKLQYDLFYIKNRSLPLDIGIILKTLNIILTAKGQ